MKSDPVTLPVTAKGDYSAPALQPPWSQSVIANQLDYGGERRSATGPALILIDEQAERRTALIAWLRPYYRIHAFISGTAALAGVDSLEAGAVLMSETLLAAGDHRSVQLLRDSKRASRLPLIVVTAAANPAALAWSGADALLPWPCSRSAALAVISPLCDLHVQARWEALAPDPRLALTRTVSAFNGVCDAITEGRGIDLQPVEQACSSLVKALHNNHLKTILAEVRSHNDYTFVHCLRVATFLALFAHATGMSDAEQEMLAIGGLLHDVGKVAVPVALLEKPGLLDADEYRLVQGHVDSTTAALRRIPGLSDVILTMASQHHEKLDGSGYPLGLAGSQLNELARIGAIVDIFGAMTDRRSYKPAFEPEAAFDFMMKNMAGQLDMRLLTIFRQCLLDGIR